MKQQEAIKKYIILIYKSILFNNDKNIFYVKHHILPRSLFPSRINDKRNIILLTPQEHILAHYYLCFIFMNNNKMLFAFNMLTNFYFTNILKENEANIIEVLKNKVKNVRPQKFSEEHKKKISESEKGKIISESTKRKLILSHRHQAKPVIGINIKTGEKIEFESIGDAYRATNIRHIAETCNHKDGRVKAGGYFWNYKTI